MLRNHLKEVFTNLSFGVQMFQHLSAGSCELNCYPGQICVCRPPLPFVDPIICSPQPPSTWTRHFVPFELSYSESGIKHQEYATQFLHCCTSSCWITLLSWQVGQWISHSFQLAYFHLPNSTFSIFSYTNFQTPRSQLQHFPSCILFHDFKPTFNLSGSNSWLSQSTFLVSCFQFFSFTLILSLSNWNINCCHRMNWISTSAEIQSGISFSNFCSCLNLLKAAEMEWNKIYAMNNSSRFDGAFICLAFFFIEYFSSFWIGSIKSGFLYHHLIYEIWTKLAVQTTHPGGSNFGSLIKLWIVSFVWQYENQQKR